MANVVETISNVKADLGAVGKDNKMEAGPAKYKYRSIDDVLNALHSGLVKNGLVFSPQLRSVTQESAGQTRSGTQQTRTVVVYDYEVFGPEGDSLRSATVGEAIDSGDKGTNKASTSAFKVFLTQLLAIPFETDDPDHSHTEVITKPLGAEKPAHGNINSTRAKAASTGKADGGETTPAAKPGARTCPTCTYAIGVKDTVKKGPDRQFHHTQCLNGEAPAASTPSADDISSIIGD